MNQPDLYHRSHKAAKADVGEIAKEYFPKFQWRNDGLDKLIDVGSGPGDVLMDYIYPLMPENFEKIVCSDISKDMIEYAQNYYKKNEKYEKFDYKVLDIGSTDELPTDLEGQFDHVTSMLCLHWVQDHKTALKNIFKLLRPETGDCLLVFMSGHTIFDAYNYARNHTKWSEYMKNIDRLISPLNGCKDPKTEFTNLMAEAGFSDIIVNIKTKTFDYGTVQNFKENVRSICGTLDTIPISQHSDFLDDFVAIMSEYATQSDTNEQGRSKSTMKYDLLVAYGKKIPQ